MDVFTLYVGQGDLTAIRAGDEAIVWSMGPPRVCAYRGSFIPGA